MPLSHYTIGYHDAEQHRHYICEYAADSYEAIKDAQEDVPALREHPSFIDYCVTEEVQKISDFMSSGIPMGR